MNEFYRMAFEESPIGFIVVDAGGTIVLTNSETERIFGYGTNELVGQLIEVLVPEVSRQEHPAMFQTYMKDPTSRRMGAGRDLHGVRKDGSLVAVEIGLSPIHTESRGVFVMGSIVDITTRKNAEDAMSAALLQVAKSNTALKELNKELESFAYVASHDLRSPLRGIDNLAHWIEEEIQDQMTDKTREYMELLHGRVERLDTLLNDLLEYSRAGKNANLTPEEVNVVDLVKDVVDLLPRPEAFHIDVDEGMPTLTTFKTPMAQVFQNLISNALRHHDREDGRIRISSWKNGDDVWEFTVEDDGPGIPEAYRQKVFELFQTLKSPGGNKSSGMGLAIVRKIVERQRGTVEIDTGIDGKGAAFRFTWPSLGQEEESNHGR